MEASTLNTNKTIFLIPRCSSRPLNYTFLSIHPFLCGHTKKMASLVSNGMETEIKDWSVMKAENPTPPIPTEKLPTPTILSTLSTKGFSELPKPLMCTHKMPEAKSWPFLFILTQKVRQVWGDQNHDMRNIHPQLSLLPNPLHSHCPKPPQLAECLPTWKIISKETSNSSLLTASKECTFLEGKSYYYWNEKVSGGDKKALG